MRTPRHRAREFAVQTIYQLLVNPSLSTSDSVNIIKHSDPYIKSTKSSKRLIVHEDFFTQLVQGVVENKKQLDELINQQTNEKIREIFPVERSILYVALYELVNMPQTPYAVIINEAVELTKTYGSPDGHRLINGMLDNIADIVRKEEVAMIRAKKLNESNLAHMNNSEQAENLGSSSQKQSSNTDSSTSLSSDQRDE